MKAPETHNYTLFVASCSANHNVLHILIHHLAKSRIVMRGMSSWTPTANVGVSGCKGDGELLYHGLNQGTMTSAV
jgi:hypothetical protein